jgi:hypothetical protein
VDHLKSRLSQSEVSGTRLCWRTETQLSAPDLDEGPVCVTLRGSTFCNPPNRSVFSPSVCPHRVGTYLFDQDLLIRGRW